MSEISNSKMFKYIFFFLTADNVTIHNLNAFYCIILQCHSTYELIIPEYHIF